MEDSLEENTEQELRGEIIALEATLELCMSILAQLVGRLDGIGARTAGDNMIAALARMMPETLAAAESVGNPDAAAGFERRIEALISRLQTNFDAL
jgi:hypothetical protein